MEAKSVQTSLGNISYFESGGTGSPIMLVHGNSSSAKSFKAIVEGSLGQNHRVVAFDLPGHGNSVRLAGPQDYNIPTYGKAVVEVAKALNMENAVFAGWSLGGHAVLEAVSDLPDAAGFAIWGTPPLAFPPDMENAFIPNPAMAAAFNPELSEEDATGFAQACFAADAIPPFDPFVADILATDGNARAGLAASIAPDGYKDEVVIISDMSKPLAVFQGEKEQLVNADYFAGLSMPSLWRGAVQTIAGSGHTPQWEKPDAFSALLSDFAADCA